MHYELSTSIDIVYNLLHERVGAAKFPHGRKTSSPQRSLIGILGTAVQNGQCSKC